MNCWNSSSFQSELDMEDDSFKARDYQVRLKPESFWRVRIGPFEFHSHYVSIGYFQLIRTFQLELFDKCMRRNSIVCLKTGGGKTYIAIKLIDELADAIRTPYAEGGKLTFFVVNNVPLVHQQAQSIRKLTSLKVGGYHGDAYIDGKHIDNWDYNIWQEIFNETQVLVLTGQILVNILNHGFISTLRVLGWLLKAIEPSLLILKAFERINLLVVDECHHARGNHPFKQIFNRYKQFVVEQGLKIRLLGLTACLVASKCDLSRFCALIKDLEETTQSVVGFCLWVENLVWAFCWPLQKVEDNNFVIVARFQRQRRKSWPKKFQTTAD